MHKMVELEEKVGSSNSGLNCFATDTPCGFERCFFFISGLERGERERDTTGCGQQSSMMPLGSTWSSMTWRIDMSLPFMDSVKNDRGKTVSKEGR